MKQAIQTLFICLVLVSTAPNALALSESAIETGTFNNKAIYGYDTVAYFTESQAVKGNDEITSIWRGAVWHFSSQTHKTMFDENPEKYAPQYGGYCSYAMSRGRFVGIDEEAFTIHDGRLYLNYSKGVRDDWLEDRDKYIKMRIWNTRNTSTCLPTKSLNKLI